MSEKPKGIPRAFYKRPSCLVALVLIASACFGASVITINIVRTENVQGTWAADFCRIIAVVLNRPANACSDPSVVIIATAQSPTFVPTLESEGTQTLFTATQQLPTLRPTSTLDVTQTALAMTNVARAYTPTRQPTFKPTQAVLNSTESTQIVTPNAIGVPQTFIIHSKDPPDTTPPLYTCPRDGQYKITIIDGAYSGDRGNYGWRNILMVYVNSAVHWSTDFYDRNPQPQALGDHAFELGSWELHPNEDEAKHASQAALNSVNVNCNAGQYIRMVVVVLQNTYQYVKGDVKVAIQQNASP